MKFKITVVILTDAQGNKTWDTRRSDCGGSDQIMVNGVDKDGNWRQFDSEDSIHVFAWAERHGMKVEQKEFEVGE